MNARIALAAASLALLHGCSSDNGGGASPSPSQTATPPPPAPPPPPMSIPTTPEADASPPGSLQFYVYAIPQNLPTTVAAPYVATAGPDGDVWLTEGDGHIAQINTSGVIASTFALPSGYLNTPNHPDDIVKGPDGALWYTDQPRGKIGRISTSGVFGEFDAGVSSPTHITVGPDMNLWFTSVGAGITSMTTAGGTTNYAIPGATDVLVSGPDGYVWFTERNANRIGKISATGGLASLVEYTVPTADSKPVGITLGSDGAIWFTELAANKIGRVDGTGSFLEYPITFAAGSPLYITVGADGALWFTELVGSGDNLVRMLPSGSMTPFPAPMLHTNMVAQVALGPDGYLWGTSPDCDCYWKFGP